MVVDERQRPTGGKCYVPEPFYDQLYHRASAAEEKPQGWPVRLLKIILNPLVILLTLLSGVSFATGAARAGTVMAMMVALNQSLSGICSECHCAICTPDALVPPPSAYSV